jgi:hypothetical protein
MEISMINQNYRALNLKEDCFFLLGGIFLLLNMIRGLKTGDASLLYTIVKKSEHPILFWWGIFLSGLGVIICLTLLLFYSD